MSDFTLTRVDYNAVQLHQSYREAPLVGVTGLSENLHRPTHPRSSTMKLPANASLAVTVSFVNANGNPAETQGDVVWETSDPAVVTVLASEDSKQAIITAGPSTGEAEITATADADLGEGVTNVEAYIGITVIAKGEAIGGEITPVHAGQGLPGQPNQPDQGLPGQGGRPDNTLPGHERPTDPDYGQGIGGRPDQGLPGEQPGVDNELPGQPGTPDNELPPETATPKG